jgi:hypothetical protein
MSTDSSSPNPDPHIEGNVSKQVNDGTEMDLWDLDADRDIKPAPAENAEEAGGRIPTQRASMSRIHTRKPADLRPKSPETEEVPGSHPAPAEPHDPKPALDEPAKPAPSPEGTGASRRNRATKKTAYVSAKKPAEETAAGSGLDAGDEIAGEIPAAGVEMVDQESPEPRKVDPAPADQSPVPADLPVSSLFSISPLSKIEKIAIFLLCSALLLGAALTLVHFSSRVPTRPLIADKVDFPVSGKIVTITAASTYWRKPVTSGDGADVVRRDTQLIPVLKLNLSSKTGVIRVFFRNEDGLLVGDAITRSVAGDSETTVAATAGFEDLGMHAAYRTGSGNRWLAQVFEAPSATSSREDFSMVLEMEIDTQIR